MGVKAHTEQDSRQVMLDLYLRYCIANSVSEMKKSPRANFLLLVYYLILLYLTYCYYD